MEREDVRDTLMVGDEELEYDTDAEGERHRAEMTTVKSELQRTKESLTKQRERIHMAERRDLFSTWSRSSPC